VGPVLARSELFVSVYGPGFPEAGAVPPADALAAAGGVPGGLVAHDRLAEAAIVRGLWTGLISLPIQLGLLFAVRATLFRAWRPPARRPGLAGSVALAVAGWTVLVPVVL